MPTKNKSSVRKIQIDWQLVIQFSELVKGLPEDEPIFVKEGMAVYNSTVNDILERHCIKANIPVISIHGLRHTHASLLLFAGVSIASVARRLGMCRASKQGRSGFIWHTTGSGKTMTSYKSTRNLLMDIPSIEKTIFLIDRKDLDTQTTMAFQSYADNDTIDVDNTDDVTALVEKMADKNRQMIVTTRQLLLVRRCWHFQNMIIQS